ncbi:MAG: 30S ribosome-binding factor RbfA [Gemmatimonadaceae bacterium]
MREHWGQLQLRSTRRADRVSEAVREEIATFLAESVKDPRVVGFVTVTGVDITPDLRHAKVFVSVMGSESEKEATFEGLASTASHLRSRVGRALRLRVAPEIQFKEDDSVARAARIESLLAGIKSSAPAPASPAEEGEETEG